MTRRRYSLPISIISILLPYGAVLILTPSWLFALGVFTTLKSAFHTEDHERKVKVYPFNKLLNAFFCGAIETKDKDSFMRL